MYAMRHLLREQLRAMSRREASAKEQLDAVQFRPDSVTGRKLLSKCRALQAENDELGKQVEQTTIQQLENQRDLHTHYNQDGLGPEQRICYAILSLWDMGREAGAT